MDMPKFVIVQGQHCYPLWRLVLQISTEEDVPEKSQSQARLAELLQEKYSEHYFPSDAEGFYFIDTLNALADKCQDPAEKQIFAEGVRSLMEE